MIQFFSPLKQFRIVCSKPVYLQVSRRLIAHNKWLLRKMANEKLPPHRDDPVIKVLDTPEFRSIFTPELATLAGIFKKYNYEIRVAGGAVRDILMGMNPKDLDFATTATPDQMRKMFEDEEIRMINVNGERHGTVTSRINDKENFEVTTLRIDVVTNGRHADVVFTTDWLLDASRRDLTINSLFLDLDGKVYDYFYGYEDLMKRRIAFVGDPAQRICEDFLRIFRYFRFYGRISDTADNHDAATIAAIKKHIEGLEIISGERIWSEYSKILEGNFHRELTHKIVECGCGRYMGLPANLDLGHFDEICLRAKDNNFKLRPISLVAAMLKNEDEVLETFARLKFSSFERNLALFIVNNRDIEAGEKPLKPYQTFVLKTIGKVSEMREYVCELLRYKGALKLLEEFEKWDSTFPITGNMVKPYVQNPKVIGEVLWVLKDVWLDSDCKMTLEQLQEYVPKVTDEARIKYEERMERLAREKKERREREKREKAEAKAKKQRI